MGLYDELATHKDLIAYDLLTQGYNIKQIPHNFSWYDLKVFLMFFDGKYSIAKRKKDYINNSNNTNLLLAHIKDLLNISNWQRTGKKGLKRPKSIFTDTYNTKKYGNNNKNKEKMTILELEQFFNKREAKK